MSVPNPSNPFYGTNRSDVITGGNGDDRIHGIQGNDTLTGGGGNDFLEGGPGRDTFVFGPGFGHDFVWDFTPSGGQHDFMQFDKAVFRDFKAVIDNSTQVGNDVVI